MSNLDVFEHVFEGVSIPKQAAVLDVGCRTPEALLFLKSRYGLGGKLVGIDRSSRLFPTEAAQRSLGIRLLPMDASLPLRFADQSFDLIFHKDVLECIPDIPAHLRDLHRLLKPGGRVVCVHRDWETLTVNGSDRPLIRKAVFRYANHLQSSWMDGCDGWAGRRLWGIFNASGLFGGRPGCFTEIETEYKEGTRGWDFLHAFAEQGPDALLSKEEAARLLADMEQTAAHGEYLFASPFYYYIGEKRG